MTIESTAPTLSDRAAVLDYLLSFDLVEEDNAAERAQYARFHVDRLIRTMALLPPLQPAARVLELGARPYAMTALLRRYTDFDITPSNFTDSQGIDQASAGTHTLVSERFGERYSLPFAVLNVETDPFPYPDASFDMVLCCELIEHLIADPCHMLVEINRVLAPGGTVFISTPNVGRLQNVYGLLRGWNVFSHYSPHGIYGRHNREYTRWEIGELLRLIGFEPNVIVDDAYSHGRLYRAMTAPPPLRRYRDNLFAIGVKRAPVPPVYPAWLYGERM